MVAAIHGSDGAPPGAPVAVVAVEPPEADAEALEALVLDSMSESRS